MTFDIDVFIVVTFLLVNLVVGLVYGKKVKTIEDYALGGRNFSTSAIVSTIVATWISGSFLFVSLSKIYTEGITTIVAYLTFSSVFLVIGYIFVPRMQEFLGDISVADSMGKLYGEKVKSITAVTGAISCLGMVAVQFKIFGSLFTMFFPVDDSQAIIISSLVVIFYSGFGGIRAVTFTDIIQFITFSIFIPIITFLLIQDVDISYIGSTIQETHFLDFKKLFDYTHPGFWSFITLLFYFTFPNFPPEIFQRILIAKNIRQVQDSFRIAFYICLAIVLATIFMTILLYYINPTLDPNRLFHYIVDNYLYTGVKGLTVIGVVAMIMSTADSNLNSSAILLADSYRLIKPCPPHHSLVLAKILTFFLGGAAIILALSKQDLLSIILATASFYMPVVNVPLMLAILGFRTSTMSVLIGMGAGFLTSCTLLLFSSIDAIIPAILMNFIFLFGSHYLLKQDGGWKDCKKKKKVSFKANSNKLNIFTIGIVLQKIIDCISNNRPREQRVYIFFGIFCFISSAATIYSIKQSIIGEHSTIIMYIYQSMLVISTFFMLHTIWPPIIRNKNFIGISWYLGLFYMLAFVSTFFVLLSGFGKLQLVIFTLNLTIIFVLTKWQIGIVIIALGFLSSINCYKLYAGIKHVNFVIDQGYFNFFYILLLIGTALIAFLKPKQEYLEATEQKVTYLESDAKAARNQFAEVKNSMQNLQAQFEEKAGTLQQKENFLLDQLKIRNEEVSKLSSVKDEFIRNVMHESNTPMTAILTMSDILYTYYDKLDKKEIKQSIKDIVNGGERLKTYISSITDLSKLSSLGYQLKKEEVNLSQLIKERPFLYKKLFPEDTDKQEFIFDVQPDVVISCDKYYITHMLDNLISNAVKYGNNKPIKISLNQDENGKVTCEIRDQGIGIPTNELIKIFDKFTVSSKTLSPAEGRGVGLALVNKIISIHGGRIWADSDGESWSVFSFTL